MTFIALKVCVALIRGVKLSLCFHPSQLALPLFDITTVRDWLKTSCQFFIQSEVKPKPILTRSHRFSCASLQPRVFASSFVWVTVLSESFVIGYSDYFGFGCTVLNSKHP